MCEADNGRKFPLPFWESSAPEQQLLPFFGACCAVSGAEDSNKKMEVTFFDHGRPPTHRQIVFISCTSRFLKNSITGTK